MYLITSSRSRCSMRSSSNHRATSAVPSRIPALHNRGMIRAFPLPIKGRLAMSTRRPDERSLQSRPDPSGKASVDRFLTEVAKRANTERAFDTSAAVRRSTQPRVASRPGISLASCMPSCSPRRRGRQHRNSVVLLPRAERVRRVAMGDDAESIARTDDLGVVVAAAARSCVGCSSTR